MVWDSLKDKYSRERKRIKVYAASKTNTQSGDKSYLVPKPKKNSFI